MNPLFDCRRQDLKWAIPPRWLDAACAILFLLLLTLRIITGKAAASCCTGSCALAWLLVLQGGLALILAVLAALWLRYRSWHLLWARYGWWCVARMVGWFRTGWRQYAWMPTAALALVWAYHRWLIGPLTAREFFTGGTGPWLQSIGVLVILAFARSLIASHNRIAIVEFTSAGKADAVGGCAKELPLWLQLELVSIYHVYEAVRESPFSPSISGEPGSPLSLTPRFDLGQVGQSLSDVVTSSAKVGIGPLQVDLGKMLTTLVGLAGGHEIRGSLVETAGSLALRATLKRGKTSLAWEVTQADLAGDMEDDDLPGIPGPAPATAVAASDQGQIVHRLVRQLAFRIFADLDQEQLGTRNWRAARQYTTGFRHIRATRGPTRQFFGQAIGQRKARLRLAERSFLRALREDPAFIQCARHLGVTYYELRWHHAAQVWLSKVADQDPDSVEARYALAKSAQRLADTAVCPDESHASEPQRQAYHHQQLAYIQQALNHCEAALTLAPAAAKIWNLKVCLLSKRVWPRRDDADWLAEIRRAGTVATALAWREYCEAVARGDPEPGADGVLSLCATNQGLMLTDGKEPRREALPILRQVRWLDPTNAELHFQLGYATLRLGDPAAAATAFRQAVRHNDDAKYLYWLARTLDLIAPPASPATKTGAEEGPAALLAKALDAWWPDELKVEAGPGSLWGRWINRTAWPDPVLGKILDAPWRDQALAGTLCALLDPAAVLLRICSRLDDAAQNPGTAAAAYARFKPELESGWAALPHPAQGQTLAHLGSLAVAAANSSKDPATAERYVREATSWYIAAIRSLETNSGWRTLGRLDLYCKLAGTYHRLNQPECALPAAVKALDLAPTSLRAHLVLAQVHTALKDEAHACAQLLLGFELDPEELELLSDLVWPYWRAVVNIPSRRARQQGIQQIIRTLERACTQADLVHLDLPPEVLSEKDEKLYAKALAKRTRDSLSQKGWAYHWLGRFYAEQCDYAAAAAHLIVALGAGYKPIEGRTALVWIHYRSKAYDAAEDAFRELVFKVGSSVNAVAGASGTPAPPPFEPEIEPALKRLAERLLQPATEGASRVDTDHAEDKPPTLWLAEAAIFSAMSWVERRVGLNKAEPRIAIAAQLLDSLKDIDPDVLGELRCELALARAALQFVRACEPVKAATAPAAGDPPFAALDEAIRALQAAAGLTGPANSHAAAFHWLARAYDRRAEVAIADKAAWQTLASLARVNRDHADLRGEYATKEAAAPEATVKAASG
jgi:tetratricopeptide (TPR) repeat protein